MAVAAVFAVPELHEAILLEIDMTTLLVSAQRVSKAWHATITASPTLQQKLFFQPTPDEDRSSIAAASAPVDAPAAAGLPPLTRNPLLVKHFSPCFFEPHAKAYFRQANCFMAMAWTPRPRRERLDPEGVLRSARLDPPEDAYIQPFRERFFRRGASWRRMLVAQPPVRRLACLRSEERHQGPWYDRRYNATISGTVLALEGDASPLRMGRLYDLVQGRAARHGSHCFWFRVHWDAMRGPAYCEASQELGARLFAQARVVVEFVEAMQPAADPKQPEDPDVFDHVFRCDEHESVEVAFSSDDDERRVEWPDTHLEGQLSKFAAAWDEEKQH